MGSGFRGFRVWGLGGLGFRPCGVDVWFEPSRTIVFLYAIRCKRKMQSCSVQGMLASRISIAYTL